MVLALWLLFLFILIFFLFFRTECFWYSKTLNYDQLASVESYTKTRWICIKILLLNCCLIRHTTQHIRNWIAFTIYDELNLFDLLKIHFYWGDKKIWTNCYFPYRKTIIFVFSAFSNKKPKISVPNGVIRYNYPLKESLQYHHGATRAPCTKLMQPKGLVQGFHAVNFI